MSESVRVYVGVHPLVQDKRADPAAALQYTRKPAEAYEELGGLEVDVFEP